MWAAVLRADRRSIAALHHDPALGNQAELLAAVAITLETGRRLAELRANVDELRASRARVIEAGQKERQRLERDFHDGAQQRLVALSLSLGLPQATLSDDASAEAMLAQARDEISISWWGCVTSRPRRTDSAAHPP
ncbi:histidine kinase [Nonomuraea sp. M3C6]|uniref:Histidine kinase n=1 Tax=Nonomuraea marmarensis TaxID=3351344 RepID=A0ABW7ALQ3_9ACTN